MYSSLPADLDKKNFNERDQANFNSASSNMSDYGRTARSANGGDSKNTSAEKNEKNFGNDDVFTLRSWNSAASIRPIENDEWQVFLLRNMEELMAGQLDCLRNHNLVSVVVAPLRNPNASCKVFEYVANLLALPFVVDGPSEKDLENIKQVYLEIKVIPHLLYASKIIAKNKGSGNHLSHQSIYMESEMLAPVSELNTDELQALECIYLLICHLVHLGNDFIIQFCDAAAILNSVPLLRQLLLLGGRKMRIVTDLLAILNLTLHSSPENAELVEQIVLGISNTEENCADLRKLLTHPSHVIRSRMRLLIKRLGASKPVLLHSMLAPKFYQDLGTLLDDSSTSMRMDAEVLKETKKIQFT